MKSSPFPSQLLASQAYGMTFEKMALVVHNPYVQVEKGLEHISLATSSLGLSFSVFDISLISPTKSRTP